jgi:hypothetical protein
LLDCILYLKFRHHYVGSVDKLFVGGGKDLICLMDGRRQFQFFPDRHITHAVITRGGGDGWKLPLSNSSDSSSLFSLSLYSFYAHASDSEFFVGPLAAAGVCLSAICFFLL